MINQRLPKIWYGGDYNPEQWDKATMEEDLRMFELAGVDVATLNVFSWAKTRRDEDSYDFTWLDEIMDRLAEEQVHVCLATSTGRIRPGWPRNTRTSCVLTTMGANANSAVAIIHVRTARHIANIRC